MDLELHETSVAQLDVSSSRNTLKLLPVGKRGKQKFVYGDDNGCLSCYEMKRGEPQLVFKTPPGGGSVTEVALGGLASAGGPVKKDRIFVAQGQNITGFSNKGKEFFKLTSSLTENINYMAVEETRIWIGCQYAYTVYDDGVDAGFFMCNDRINALIVDVISRDNVYEALVGCQDKSIRVLQGSTLVCQIPVDGPVTALCSYLSHENDGALTRAGAKRFIYGTENGLVGLLTIGPGGEEKGGLTGRKGWLILNDRKLGAVTCLGTLNLAKEEATNVCVGRDDGYVQVYGVGPEGPRLRFERDVGESIRSLACGIVNTVDYPEMVISCCSGRIISYTTEPLKDKAMDDQYGRSLGTVQNENKIRTLKKEIETLRAKIDAEREKYMRQTQDAVPLSQPFQVMSTFSLEADEAAYKLVFEIPSPIDVICLKSTVRLELLGHTTESDANRQTGGVITSIMPHEVAQQGGAALMATFRPADPQTKRLVIKARTTEGEYGDILATVVAKMSPKSAQTLKLRVRPLSLHQRTNELTAEEQSRPKNTLRVSGNFSVSVMHEWISLCLPEVPPRITSGGEEANTPSGPITLFFRNVFVGAVMTVQYQKGVATIASDSISSVAIFREVITREANTRRIQINDSFKVREETVPVFLRLMHPHLQRQATAARQVGLIDAIKELQMADPENADDWLSPEYQQILRDAEQIRSEVKKRPRALEYLCGIVTDLFVDLNKFRGHDVMDQDGGQVNRRKLNLEGEASKVPPQFLIS